MDMVEKVARWGNNAMVIATGLLLVAVIVLAR